MQLRLTIHVTMLRGTTNTVLQVLRTDPRQPRRTEPGAAATATARLAMRLFVRPADGHVGLTMDLESVFQRFPGFQG